MYEKEFKEIYEAIDKIVQESCYSGWQKIADNLYKKVEALENKINESSKNNSFTITCNHCGSHNVTICEDIDYDWEENSISTGNYYLKCNDCEESE